MKYYSIAIDGPAGSGKGTIAKALAAKLNYLYIDTGAMYRAVGLYFLKHNLEITEENVKNNLNNINVKLKYVDKELKVYLNSEDVSLEIRTEEASRASSKVSVFDCVREKLVSMQQKMALEANVIMEGRDIGTVVLPNANLKIFLTASVLERAKRRYKEQIEKGLEVSLDAIEKDIKERDYRDTNRENSPLKQAEDAILIDSSEMTIDEVVNKVLSLCKVGGKYEKNE